MSSSHRITQLIPEYHSSDVSLLGSLLRKKYPTFRAQEGTGNDQETNGRRGVVVLEQGGARRGSSSRGRSASGVTSTRYLCVGRRYYQPYSKSDSPSQTTKATTSTTPAFSLVPMSLPRSEGESESYFERTERGVIKEKSNPLQISSLISSEPSSSPFSIKSSRKKKANGETIEA